MHWPHSLTYLQIFKFWIPNHKFIYRIILIVILFTYKALSQIEQTIIVFSNEHSGQNKSCAKMFSIKLK